MVRVKICGITSPADAQLCAALGAHSIGLNFFPDSSRAISPYTARAILRELPPFVTAVGIFVNWVPEAVIVLSQALRLSYAQLHGDESPATVAEIARKIPVIKALRLAQGGPLPKFASYRGVSTFLLDAASTGEFGGSGQTTDWVQARTAAKSNRIILAGGLTPENIAEAIATAQPYAVDVASGVESRPGKKDPGKLRDFFREVERANEIYFPTADPDPFVGKWKLDPATLHYEHGRPGRRACYRIESVPGGLLFKLDADNADGKPMKITYGGLLDGRERPAPGEDGILILSRLSETVIESSLKREGHIVDRWTRELLPDGKTMRIIQFGTKPGGEKFRNTSFYRRAK